eukprot:CAMPEP_0167826136 /NCGR_PEP_ID=MMETSP0112_2-20121227/9828_1 /TAXON_ID=91324 /ORGANISM="Lotharella globosa, Strain CCCM811" /LENGTH=339 /DNA_ID=CAMNT_0007728469 /DNA_START=193 /DNA_END=1208 /DNA_ORIENTATION=+
MTADDVSPTDSIAVGGSSFVRTTTCRHHSSLPFAKENSGSRRTTKSAAADSLRMILLTTSQRARGARRRYAQLPLTIPWDDNGMATTSASIRASFRWPSILSLASSTAALVLDHAHHPQRELAPPAPPELGPDDVHELHHQRGGGHREALPGHAHGVVRADAVDDPHVNGAARLRRLGEGTGKERTSAAAAAAATPAAAAAGAGAALVASGSVVVVVAGRGQREPHARSLVLEVAAHDEVLLEAEGGLEDGHVLVHAADAAAHHAGGLAVFDPAREEVAAARQPPRLGVVRGDTLPGLLSCLRRGFLLEHAFALALLDGRPVTLLLFLLHHHRHRRRRL